MYHKKLPATYVPLAQDLNDKLVKKEIVPYLDKEKWESAYTVLSRTINETKVVGKP